MLVIHCGLMQYLNISFTIPYFLILVLFRSRNLKFVLIQILPWENKKKANVIFSWKCCSFRFWAELEFKSRKFLFPAFYKSTQKIFCGNFISSNTFCKLIPNSNSICSSFIFLIYFGGILPFFKDCIFHLKPCNEGE